MAKVKLPAFKKSWLRGWPLVVVLAIALTVVALGYGGATDQLGSTCTVTVQAAEVTVRAAPSPSAQSVGTLTRGEEVPAETIVDTGFRKLTGGDRWVPSNSVAATAGSRC
ncbi:hypothetical protein SAMN05216207_100814 [Pseudonocardia ammonioxydans]|uniref:SH3 domain-containing protein n=1 Tax=Pseudonocardia ammonioxydans TaxID=260086 RepID=A0A1I4WAK4_PSUAM|nr:hypothetical protein [Pseudonocardia ammonioxydans]SFN10413.1 hypothetical protein SAMN05216207_100814 [Pseudonocardia ammonioxydans]